MSATVIALDLGTSGAKAVRFTCADKEAPVFGGRATGPYAPVTRHPGMSELDAEAVWRGACAALRALPPGPSPDALALSSQTCAAMAAGADGRPLSPVLTWADVRAGAQARALRACGLGRSLHARCGCPPAAIYPVAKWRHWTETGWPAGTARMGGVKEFVMHRLTGAWVLDTGTASSTGACDLLRRRWDPEALAWAGMPAAWMPEVVPVRQRFSLGAEAARATGLPAGLPVVIGGSDGPLASLGAGAGRVGAAAMNAGTSAAVRARLPAPACDPDGGLWTYVIDGDACVAGGIVVGAGSLLDWLGKFCGGLQPAQLADLAAAADDDGPRCCIRSAGPHAPDWDETPRFDLEGLRPGHGPGEATRAVLRGVAEALAEILRMIERRTGPVSVVRAGGSIGRSQAWLPIAAAALGRPIELITEEDPSARGAALVALAALGAIADPFDPCYHPVTTLI